MKLAYKDLIKFLGEKPSRELLSKRLFQLGHEHEIHGDIFDMELTPNRGDCLSLNGLARDLNVFFGRSEAVDIYEDIIDSLKIDFENLAPSDCPKISFLEIEIDKTIDDYKPYLENYLSAIGNKKTNLFTDISNYISYELGQPTHCFDRNAINNKLVFENKECNSTFKTLLGSDVVLKDHNCVFTQNSEIISLAGVMGGASTACSVKTRKVLIECAYFNPESIIGKSIKYNLISDAAHRFERGVDMESQEMVLRRFAKVVQDHAEIKSIKLKSFRSSNSPKISIPKNISKINKILGTNLKEIECLSYLRDLGFNISNDIEVPSHRHDIRTNNDLAEEVARVIGYNNIKNTPINLKKIIDDKSGCKVTQLESLLVNNGFSEVINFPFTSKNDKRSISIDNPLDSNRNYFRTSLMESLVNNLLYNERRQKDSIKLFEISDIYSKGSEINQQKKLGLIVSGRLGNNFNDFTKKLDKNYLNRILDNYLSEGIFKIIEISRNSLDTKKKDKIFYVEISLDDINALENQINKEKTINFISYKPVSEYPSSTRDFSFSIDDMSKVHKVINELEKVSENIIKNSYIFDFYKNEKTKIVKLGCRFIFQSNHKTLSDIEINAKVQEILNPLLIMDGVSIPGMDINKPFK